jgi:hypothetical protein
MAYYANGTLPEANTVCETDAKMFSGDRGWEGVLQKLANGE